MPIGGGQATASHRTGLVVKGKRALQKSAVSARDDNRTSASSKIEQAAGGRKLLVFDLGYTFEAVRQRSQEAQILYRDLDGYFAHVWNVHPFATLLTSDSWGPRFGRPATYELAPRHTVIEGKVGRFAWLKGLFPLNFLLSQADLFFRLRSLIKRENINVIRAPGPLYEGLFALALARATGIPLVVRVGANNDKHFETTGTPMEPRLMRSRKIEKIVERFVFRRADLVAGANQDNLDFALANGASPERSTLFRYGNLVDPRHFEPPDKRGKATQALRDLGVESGKFILYVGRLTQIKQPEHVIEVLARLRSRGLDVKAVLAGEGPMKADLEKFARGLAVAEDVVMPGSLDQGQLALLYPEAAAVISPHTGRALAEAALGGAPVVAYDVDWQSEVIETGKTGFLIDHGNIEEMSEAAYSLLTDPARAKKLGSALREHVLEMLDPEQLNEHERQEYGKLLARFSAAR
jgi:glycosyltransferase involved in cell wall biosynthesis